MYHGNDKFVKNVIKDIRHKRWDRLQKNFAEILIQVPETAPMYHTIFQILLMAITLNNPDAKTRYNNSKNLPEKMIRQVRKLKQG